MLVAWNIAALSMWKKQQVKAFPVYLADIPHLHFRGVFFRFFHLQVLRV